MVFGRKEDTSATPLIWDLPANPSLPRHLIPPPVLQVPVQVERLSQLPVFQDLNKIKLTLPLTELGLVEQTPELGFYSIDKYMGKRERKASWENIHTSKCEGNFYLLFCQMEHFPWRKEEIWPLGTAATGMSNIWEKIPQRAALHCPGQVWFFLTVSMKHKSPEVSGGTCTQVVMAGLSPRRGQ